MDTACSFLKHEYYEISAWALESASADKPSQFYPFADSQKEIRTLGEGMEQSERRGEGVDHRGCRAHGPHDAEHHVRG